ncbi:hypothetical protein [Siphonobacter curvatus]|uniref:Uncharacterized protein n=1 Tax=Siphonobacter curvatus TaxID=2094562 RepID=A0A2S7IIG5_9BACT|nr:hypothetical protein [Siphonobacter curvatus]PQA56188.1 hypothetical protein C5O19_17715 [Siphonobacter curvatus]
MGKRLVRLPATDPALPGLTGKHLNVVLRNGVTYAGRLLGQENQELILEDGLLRERRYPVRDIEEIVYDKTTAF